MSTSLIKESISALTELVEQSLNEETLDGATELSTQVTQRLQNLLNISKKGFFLKELSTFLAKVVKKYPGIKEAFDSLEFRFEIGPQYNDEGYDLRITYDSKIEVVVAQECDTNFEDTLDDMFHDWIYGALSPSDFEGWFNKPVSLNYNNTMTVYIADPESLFNSLTKNSNPTVGEFSRYLSIDVESDKAQGYY